jgi:large subunit ribosomal protein L31
MKEKIHPQYFTDAQVTCSCGNKFTTGSTRKQLKVELCNKCHPFFTGEQKIIDTAGRVERFKKKYKLDKAEK